MTLLGRDAILGADDLRYEVVPCPEWGGDVRIRSLTGAQRDRFEVQLGQQAGLGGTGKPNVAGLDNVRASLLALCIVDEDGQPLFTAADVAALGGKNALVIERLFTAARRLSGLTDGDVEELTENFGAAPNGPSTSG